MIGYPAGHGQDSNINDHHFHWGYFIHAASFIEQMQPGWALEWGEMVNELVWDAASHIEMMKNIHILEALVPIQAIVGPMGLRLSLKEMTRNLLLKVCNLILL